MIPGSRLPVSQSRSDKKTTISSAKKERKLRETLVNDKTERKEKVENKQREPKTRGRAWTWESREAVNMVIRPPQEEKAIDISSYLSRARKHGVTKIQGAWHIQRRSFDSLFPVHESSRSFEDLRKLSVNILASYKFIKEPKQRPSVYEEEPFYLRPENGSFRRKSWQSGMQSQPVSSRSDQDRTETSEHEETPLAEILPPLLLPSIYEQESRKKDIKSSGKKQRNLREKPEKKPSHTEHLTRGLKDCRYLRIPQSRFNLLEYNKH